jgi:hypothetical protein
MEKRQATPKRVVPERSLATDRAHAVGRDGEVLVRKRGGGNLDQFVIPDNLAPDGWAYQWNTVSVFNNRDVVVGQGMRMYEAGWRAVPAERHPGMFVPVGTKGEIVRDGMRLEERPLILNEEAKDEEERAARQLVSDRNQALKLTGAGKELPQGFEMRRERYRGTGGQVKISIDHGTEGVIPSGSYQQPED